jgi:hypothetical protein
MNIPEGVQRTIEECISEGRLFVITSGEDSSVMIVPEVVSGHKWISYFEWWDVEGDYKLN